MLTNIILQLLPCFYWNFLQLLITNEKRTPGVMLLAERESLMCLMHPVLARIVTKRASETLTNQSKAIKATPQDYEI